MSTLGKSRHPETGPDHTKAPERKKIPMSIRRKEEALPRRRFRPHSDHLAARAQYRGSASVTFSHSAAGPGLGGDAGRVFAG